MELVIEIDTSMKNEYADSMNIKFVQAVKSDSNQKDYRGL